MNLEFKTSTELLQMLATHVKGEQDAEEREQRQKMLRMANAADLLAIRLELSKRGIEGEFSVPRNPGEW